MLSGLVLTVEDTARRRLRELVLAEEAFEEGL